MRPKTVTAQIEEKAFEILAEHPNGLRWSDLNQQIKVSNPNFHPKTINGTVWKLAEKFPEKVYKADKGLFRLTKFR